MIGEFRYVYDGLDQIAELDSLNQLIFGYTHGPGIDDPLIMRYNGADYFYHKNHQGSVTEVASSSGSIVKNYKYDAFGNILQESGAPVYRGFTYTARERHSRSGLYYYRARWYDPAIGRFITQDPIGWAGGMNLYAYCGDDPVNRVDPLGLWGIGASGSATTDLGVYFVGLGLNGAIGGGLFGSGFGNFNAGGFASLGGFAGGPIGNGYGVGFPSARACEKDTDNSAVGAFGGAGLNIFITNADNANELSGPSRAYNLNVGWGARVLSLQFALGSNGIWMFSYGGPLPGALVTGGGYGISYSNYNTFTWTTK